jgi:hypothetical protein
MMNVVLRGWNTAVTAVDQARYHKTSLTRDVRHTCDIIHAKEYFRQCDWHDRHGQLEP